MAVIIRTCIHLDIILERSEAGPDAGVRRGVEFG